MSARSPFQIIIRLSCCCCCCWAPWNLMFALRYCDFSFTSLSVSFSLSLSLFFHALLGFICTHIAHCLPRSAPFFLYSQIHIGTFVLFTFCHLHQTPLHHLHRIHNLFLSLSLPLPPSHPSSVAHSSHQLILFSNFISVVREYCCLLK